MTDETMPPLAASIIICTRNRPADLRECLASLPWKTMGPLRAEVIVVDDGGEPGEAAGIANEHPGVRLVRMDAPGGPSAARNAAARIAQGDLLVFLDDDTLTEPLWLETLLNRHDGRTVLGGRILDYRDGREQGGPAFSTFLGKRLPCRPERATVGTSANMAAPRACFEEIGGFDLDLPYYFEDSDFCIRARKAGFSFAYVPGAAVRHKGYGYRRGEAIALQEEHSTLAMLKAYRKAPGKLVLFTLGNGTWLTLRLLLWILRGRFADCRRLLRGWLRAHRRFLEKLRNRGPW